MDLSGDEAEGRPGWGTSRVGTALGPLDSECKMFVTKFLVLKTVRRPLADINPECDQKLTYAYIDSPA